MTDNQEIVQSWFSSEFEEEGEPSKLTLRFKDNEAGCELTLIHNEIPEGQPDYKQGWEEHYFAPLREYFKQLTHQ